MGVIKVAHTSNVHLGKRFPQMEREDEAIRTEDLLRVFGDLVAHLIKNGTHLLIVAGDMFEMVSARRETVNRILDLFGKFNAALPDSHIVLTPGEDEVFLRKDGRQDCMLSVFEHLPYVDIIGASPEVDRRVFDFSGAEVTVSSCSYDKFFDPEFKPRAIPAVKRGFGIFVLHAFSRRLDLRGVGDDDFRDKVLDPLAARGYSYCALGHSPIAQSFEHKGLRAVYPGSLERLSFETDRGKKTFVAFTVDENGKMGAIETGRSGARPMEYITLNCTPGDFRFEKMLDDLVQRGGKDKILCIALDGRMDFDTYNRFKKSETLKKLRERFAIVHIENHLVLIDGETGYDFNALRVGTPLEEFRRHMEVEISQTAPGSSERKLLAELYKLGIREIEQEL